jgi:hypothetical protein
MTRPRDSYASRVYNADATFKQGTLEIHRAEQHWADRIAHSAWWKKRAPDIVKFDLRHSGNVLCDYRFTKAPRAGGNPRAIQAVVNLPTDAYLADLCHAVAHYLHPENTAWHGPEFAKAMLDVVGKFMGLDERRRLAALYKANKVKTVRWSDEAKDRAKHRHAERDLKALLDELKSSDTPSS